MIRYFIILLLPLSTWAQSITITPGASLVLSGNALLTIQDGGFTNNGSFLPGSGTVVFSGTIATTGSSIGGSSSTAFNNVMINKSLNDVQLNSNIAVNGNLTMQSGNLQLNNYTIDLGSGVGAIIGENNNARITGLTGGTVNKTASLNAPAAANPGNIGVEITSTANLGATLIKRGHAQQTSSNGGLSIYRYYDITPTNNNALNASLKFYYFDNELAGRNKPELTQWESANGGVSWHYLGQDQLDNTNDWVLKNSIAGLNRVTLASNITNALPLQLLYFTGILNNGEALLNWVTTNEYNNDHFNLERSPGGAAFSAIANIKSWGNSTATQTYQYTDPHPFNGYNYYRLKQVDINGVFTYSPIVTVLNNAGFEYTAFPNPAKDKFTMVINAARGRDVYFDLLDMAGRIVSAKELHLLPGSNTYDWDISRLTGGIYLLQPRDKTLPALKIMKE